MNENILKLKFSKDSLIEAEIFSTWGCFFQLYKSNKKILTLTQSIIFKLQQSHYHLIQALRYSDLSINELNKTISNDRQYYNFVTNCNIDSMIHALNSVMDVIAKLLTEIYSEINLKCKYFKDFDTKPTFLSAVEKLDSKTAEIIKSISTMNEREYVRDYCNENKHERAFFSAGSYMDFDIEKEGIIKGYKLKNKFKREKEDKELNEYAQQIFNTHKELICQLGKSLLQYKVLEPFPVDENFLRLLEMSSSRYYR